MYFIGYNVWEQLRLCFILLDVIYCDPREKNNCGNVIFNPNAIELYFQNAIELWLYINHQVQWTERFYLGGEWGN